MKTPPRHILGISAYYHDSAAAILDNGRILAAAQEERFSRKKNDERFPHNAVRFCLENAGITASNLDAVVFYDKPIVKFTRIIESFLHVAPRGLTLFPRVMPAWLSEKLDLRKTVRAEIDGLPDECPILFTEHHQAHAASAFFPSPFKKAAVLTIDGVGEWATTTIGRGDGHKLELFKELRFPHSLGLLYSAFTAYCGFRVNSGEYKLMGLAPYGEPRFVNHIKDNLIDLKPDGSFRLNIRYFGFLKSLSMTNNKFHSLFEGPPRKPNEPIQQRHMDVACSIQRVIEEAVLNLALHARSLTNEDNLCLAGGVALNCVANGRLLKENIFNKIWIQPAAGDAGGALGAALAYWNYSSSTNTSHTSASHNIPSGNAGHGSMQGAFLGPEFTNSEIEIILKSHSAVYEKLDTPDLIDQVVDILASGKVIGWFQGRMEFGPRALGNRSILGDPRSPEMQSKINLKIKFRESFRPFAPVVLLEHAADFFELDTESPYMLMVAPVREQLRKTIPKYLRGMELLRTIRSSIPAITHVDYSARIQTVDNEQNQLLYRLLKRFN
ncbi:MAG: hypothetical protein K9N48_02400, partial [Verrucomicrobia bacterium]|nr:hypothetical protein [Verrucomicrobiota bacterium]